MRLQRVRLTERVLLFYGVVALGYRLVFSTGTNPVWLPAFAAATGCVWIALAWPPKTSRSKVTLGGLAFLALVLLSGSQLMLVLIGSALATAGLLGVASRRIVLAGRAGPPRAYRGWTAVAPSAALFVAGTVSIFWALTSPQDWWMW